MSLSPQDTDTTYHDIAETWIGKFPNAAPHSHLISSAAHFAQRYMSQPHFGSSHNFNHIRRVVALAGRILENEQSLESEEPKHDASLIVLGTLLHDVGDRKYSTESDAADAVKQILLHLGADEGLANRGQNLVDCVSYSFESKNPRVIQATLSSMPELAVVQDADRLDAIGAVGIGRCFTFTGAKNKTMEDAVEHFSEKLLKLENMMKTPGGKEMAQERTKRLKKFLDWWGEEAAESGDYVSELGSG